MTIISKDSMINDSSNSIIITDGHLVLANSSRGRIHRSTNSN